MTQTGSTSLHFRRALLPEGWAADVRLELSGGCIAAVTVGTPPGPTDERAEIGLPGVPNLHSHAFQRGMAGLTERRGPTDDSFWTWREAMYRFVDRLTPEDNAALAAMAYVEMLEAGFTRVGEFHYLHNDLDGRPYAEQGVVAAGLAAAAEEAGIGLTLLPVFYAHAGFGGQPPAPAQRRFVLGIEAYARLLDVSSVALRDLPDAVLGVAPHSLRAVTPEELAAVTGLSAGPVHIHIAEQVREVEDCLAWAGARPVEWLLDRAGIDDRWCLVHATHMTPMETQRLAASGAVAGLCPITEANLGDGLFPLSAFLAAGGRIGVGSDSNVLISAQEELRLLEYGQRLATQARNVAAERPGASTGRRLLDAAVAGGGQALGVTCHIAPGAPADLVSLDAYHPALACRDGDEILDSFIFAGAGAMIRGVWRRGRKVVSDGVHYRRSAVAERYRRTLARLLAS